MYEDVNCIELDDGESDDSRGARAGGIGSHDKIELSVISTIQTEK